MWTSGASEWIILITEKLALGSAAINRQRIVPEVSTDITATQPAVKIYQAAGRFIQSVYQLCAVPGYQGTNYN